MSSACMVGNHDGVEQRPTRLMTMNAATGDALVADRSDRPVVASSPPMAEARTATMTSASVK